MKLAPRMAAVLGRPRLWERRHRWLGLCTVVAALAIAGWVLTPGALPPPGPERSGIAERADAPGTSPRSVNAPRTRALAGRAAPADTRLARPDPGAARADAPGDESFPRLDWERVPRVNSRSREQRALASDLAGTLSLKLGDAISECMERGKGADLERAANDRAAHIQLELWLRPSAGTFVVQDTVFTGGVAADESVQSCLRAVFAGADLSAPSGYGGGAYRLPFTIWF